MDKQARLWRGQRLLQAGISRKVVKRYLRELDAHYSDLLVQAKLQGLDDATAAAWAKQKLGSDEYLLETMLETLKGRPELRSWPHRHPWLATLLLPTVIYLVSGIAAFLICAALVGWLGPDAGAMVTRTSLPQWVNTAISAVIWLLTYALTPLLAIGLALWARWHYLRPFHQIAGIVLLCVLGSGMTIEFDWPQPEQQHSGTAAVGFGYAWDENASLESAFHKGKKWRLAGNLTLCAGVLWLLRQRQQAPQPRADNNSPAY